MGISIGFVSSVDIRIDIDQGFYAGGDRERVCEACGEGYSG